MKINKTILILVFGTLFFAGSVFAQTDNSQIIKKQDITAKDLGITSPGILPGNPFYFLKDWSRGIQDTLTFDPVKKAELQLDVVNQKAVEIKKLKDFLPSSSKNLSEALDDYRGSIDSLGQKAGDVKNSSVPEMSVFLDKLSGSLIKHIQLFSQLKSGTGDVIKNKLSALQGKIAELIVKVLSANETPDQFRGQLERIVRDQDSGAFKEITIAEVLDRLDEKTFEENRLGLLKVQENLLLKFQSRLQSEDFSRALSEIMPQLPGDPVRKIKILDEIREGISDNNIKNNLNIIRQDLLQKAVDSKEIRKPEVESIIDQANALISDLSNTIASSSIPKSATISGLVSKASFNLIQAKQALALDNYVQAFGQASASISAANYALIDIDKFNGHYAEDDLTNLKQYHDELASQIDNAELNASSTPDIFSAMSTSEIDIAKISDLVKKNPKADTLISLIKEAKLLLSWIDNQLADLSQAKKS
ncbi:MAG: DUF5667 domain-containing protein [Patescibacteria group bacterium]|nr:DUF5667 domain-containing protein [Patescibacteria group bacterium]